MYARMWHFSECTMGFHSNAMLKWFRTNRFSNSSAFSTTLLFVLRMFVVHGAPFVAIMWWPSSCAHHKYILYEQNRKKDRQLRRGEQNRMREIGNDRARTKEAREKSGDDDNDDDEDDNTSVMIRTLTLIFSYVMDHTQLQSGSKVTMYQTIHSTRLGSYTEFLDAFFFNIDFNIAVAAAAVVVVFSYPGKL